MDYLKYTEKLSSLEYYIKSKSAVTVDDLSKRLQVSRRTVLRMVDCLKLQGKEIKYSKKLKSYFFEQEK